MMNTADCPTGNCPPSELLSENRIKLSEGSGGTEMARLIQQIRGRISNKGDWNHTLSDSAILSKKVDNIVFTTDSYVVTPLFFPGGNIGKIAFCGTVNDLVVMGAQPLGLSLGVIAEEGLPKDTFFEIMDTIGGLSEEYDIPIATGDTKVMERRSVDKLILNTSGVGTAEKRLVAPLEIGDKIIVSGGIGEHAATLLACRFELETELMTDSQPLIHEMNVIRPYIKQARDITRGGLAAILNEWIQNTGKGINVVEEAIPLRQEVKALTDILGMDPHALACEGRMAVVCSPENSEAVVTALKKFNPLASEIGEVTPDNMVTVQTVLGKKRMPMPSGILTPRIC